MSKKKTAGRQPSAMTPASLSKPPEERGGQTHPMTEVTHDGRQPAAMTPVQPQSGTPANEPAGQPAAPAQAPATQTPAQNSKK